MSRLNRLAAAVGLVAGGLATWAMLQPIVGRTPERPPSGMLMFTTWDEVHEWTGPEWRRRLAEMPPSGDWLRRRHHCSPAVLGEMAAFAAAHDEVYKQ